MCINTIYLYILYNIYIYIYKIVKIHKDFEL